MTYYDFSSGFNLLNQGINSLGQALGNQYDTQGYQQIAQALSGANPDYAKAMSLAAAYGKPDLMLHFSDAAQRQQFGAQFQREYGAGGGGTGTAPLQPTTTPTGTQPAGTQPPTAAGTGGATAAANFVPVTGGDEWVQDPQGHSWNVAALKYGLHQNESKGYALNDSYGAQGPLVSADRGRAVGRYQVMPENIPGWTQKYYGQALTPEQFAQNPDAQEKVVEGTIRDQIASGGIQGLQKFWFGPGASDRYTSQAQYRTGLLGGYSQGLDFVSGQQPP